MEVVPHTTTTTTTTTTNTIPTNTTISITATSFYWFRVVLTRTGIATVLLLRPVLQVLPKLRVIVLLVLLCY